MLMIGKKIVKLNPKKTNKNKKESGEACTFNVHLWTIVCCHHLKLKTPI
jgi:hypothetical protein